MKKFLFTVITLSAFTIQPFAQNDVKPNTFEYIIIDSATTNIYNNARLFIAERFNSAKDVIQLDDPTTGNMLVKGLFKIEMPGPGSMGMVANYGNVEFMLKIQVKGNRYKITLNDLDHSKGSSGYPSGGPLVADIPACGTFTFPKKHWAAVKKEADERALSLISGLNSAIKKEDSF